MIIKEALGIARNKLIKNKIEAPGLISGVLLSFILNCDRAYLFSHSQTEISKDNEDIFLKYLERIIAGEPLSYVLGYKDFLSFRFLVGKGVLIPRPETELLVEEIIKFIDSNRVLYNKPINILDICTGTGCIAISIAKLLRNKGYTCLIKGVDISDDALNYARKNAILHGVDDIVDFSKHDIFQDEKSLIDPLLTSCFDIIVSNPPYIVHDDIPRLDANVRGFEPVLALDGGTDGLDFYRRISDIAPLILCDNGSLFFEVGYDQAKQVESIMSSNFSDITIKKDFSGIDRIVFGMLY